MINVVIVATLLITVVFVEPSLIYPRHCSSTSRTLLVYNGMCVCVCIYINACRLPSSMFYDFVTRYSCASVGNFMGVQSGGLANNHHHA